MPESTLASRALTINGFEMYVKTMGQGDPLLLVHGWSGNADYFEPLLEELSSHYLLIIPELRGHGRSTNPSRSFSTRQAAADVSVLLDSLHIDHVRALGASAGALTLMHLALVDPSLVESMILVGSGTHFPPPCRATMAAADADTYPPQWCCFLSPTLINPRAKIGTLFAITSRARKSKC